MRRLASLALLLAACSTVAPASTPDRKAPPRPSTLAAATATAPRPERIGTDPGGAGAGTPLVPREGHALAAFAGGCFWGVEDVFRHVPGVVATAVGFTGGHTDNPTYPIVCTHTTGHAETVLVEYDPKRVGYERLLHVFFESHDPTTFNRQGPDVGDQYRSAIFTFSEQQRAAAERAKAATARDLKRKVATAITPMSRFWKAEEYHQQYDEKTGRHSCPLPNLDETGT